MTLHADLALTRDDIAAMTVRDLSDRFPETMPALAALGLDLCCGGGHPLGEALDLHGINREDGVALVLAAIAAAGERR